LAASAATTYYVRAGGDDDHDGLTPATALASVRPAARRLREPGDRLIVGPGTYREGNISPFGNGTPAAPMVLFGDASGAATGDPPGRVLILPPNTPKADSGFLIRGRNDVVIEGFEIAGARDASIDIRHRPRTGAESTRIAVRNNRVRGGARMAIQIRAEGDVEVSGNHLLGDDEPRVGSGDGLVVHSGAGGTLQLRMVGNIIDDRFIGISGGGMVEALLEGNEVRTNARNLQFSADRLTLISNQFHGPVRGGEVRARELVAADNRFDARVAFGATESLDLQRNTIHPHAGIRRTPAHARIAENAITALSIGGAGTVELIDNEGLTLRAQGVEALVANGNRFADEMKAHVAGSAAVADNDSGALIVRAGVATIERNAVTRRARIVADDATVTGNTVGELTVHRRRHRDDPPTAEEAFAIRDNTVGGGLVAGGAACILLRGNSIDGLLRTTARDTIDLVDNQAQGIVATASAAGSHVTVKENRSQGSLGPGLMIVGAERATVVSNVSSDNAGAGLVVRRVATLVVSGNELRANREGGASIRVPPVGDCNENVDVTIGELLRVVGVTLQRAPLHFCDAADANRDRQVTVDEVVLGVGSALGRPDPLTSRVELRGNVVEDNQRRGLDVYARAFVEATDNRILRNGGIPLAVQGRLPLNEVLVARNVLGGGAAEGLMLEAIERSVVRDNIIVGNRDAGILLRAAPHATVTNNLIYANGAAGIVARLGSGPDDMTEISHNTFFANGRWGLVLGQARVTSTGAVVRNNIIDQNVGGGLAVVENAVVSLTVERNLNTDGYSDDLPPGETDLDEDPQFVDPDGADGILGADGWADDDFHLQPQSPAIDGIGFRYPAP
jgi:nitrous oxidase accessory protein NosD